MTDGAGEVVAALDVDEHGRVLARTGDRTMFGFQGQYGVVDLGGDRYAMGLRVYDATLGRFLQPDPIDLAGGFDRYAFADGVPVSRIDPTGTMSKGWFGDFWAEWADGGNPLGFQFDEISRATDYISGESDSYEPGPSQGDPLSALGDQFWGFIDKTAGKVISFVPGGTQAVRLGRTAWEGFTWDNTVGWVIDGAKMGWKTRSTRPAYDPVQPGGICRWKAPSGGRELPGR